MPFFSAVKQYIIQDTFIWITRRKFVKWFCCHVESCHFSSTTEHRFMIIAQWIVHGYIVLAICQQSSPQLLVLHFFKQISSDFCTGLISQANSTSKHKFVTDLCLLFKFNTFPQIKFHPFWRSRFTYKVNSINKTF